jgi:hypothetical protein
MKRNLQKERQQRGDDFQNEMRASWRLLPNVWRLRLTDGGGSSRPGDELILLDKISILAEHKRTYGDRFELGFLRPSQLKGLQDFDRVIARNLGLVFVSFLNEEKGTDEAYAFRLLRALHFMQQHERRYITRDELKSNYMPCIELPRLQDTQDRLYDLKGVLECYKSL